jgi:hypothetical protein
MLMLRANEGATLSESQASEGVFCVSESTSGSGSLEVSRSQNMTDDTSNRAHALLRLMYGSRGEHSSASTTMYLHADESVSAYGPDSGPAIDPLGIL